MVRALRWFQENKDEYEKVTKGLGELNARYLVEREKQEKKQRTGEPVKYRKE